MKTLNINAEVGFTTEIEAIHYFKTKDGYKFGNVRETISYVLKVNYEAGTLRYLGKPLYNIINKLDPGHFDNLKF